MLYGKTGDPEIIGWNGCTCSFQLKEQTRVDFGCFTIGVKNIDARLVK